MHGEILLLHHQFNKELLSFQPEPEEEEQASTAHTITATARHHRRYHLSWMIALLPLAGLSLHHGDGFPWRVRGRLSHFPSLARSPYGSHPRSARPGPPNGEPTPRSSHPRVATRCLASHDLGPDQVPTDAGGFDDAWAASDLLTEISIFSPIACIFVYQQRSQSMIPNLSRVWRFAFGTYLACAYAEWVIWLAGNHPVGTTQLESLRASQLGWVVAMMAASSVAGTFMHSGDYFGYTGLVVAFTVPIILIGW